MAVYLMIFESKQSKSTLSEIADTPKDVIKYCGRILAEDEYRISKILKVNIETLIVDECYLRLTNSELHLEEPEDLPF